MIKISTAGEAQKTQIHQEHRTRVLAHLTDDPDSPLLMDDYRMSIFRTSSEVEGVENANGAQAQQFSYTKPW